MLLPFSLHSQPLSFLLLSTRGPLPGLLLPLPRCPVPGAPGVPVPGLGPARGHPSTDSDGPGVSDPALERMPRSEGHVFTERTSAPLCFQPTARCGDPGVGGQGKHCQALQASWGPRPGWTNRPWALTVCPCPPARGRLVIRTTLAEAAEWRSGPQHSPAGAGFAQLSPGRAGWQI